MKKEYFEIEYEIIFFTKNVKIATELSEGFHGDENVGGGDDF